MTQAKELLGNIYKATKLGLGMGFPPVVVVRCDSGNTVSYCLLDSGIHRGWLTKNRFREYYELLDEGIWEGDKVLIIDRVYLMESGYLKEIIK